MTCYITHDANGKVIGTLCGDLGPACVECGDVSGVLCDFPLSDEQRTCDAPLCERCSPTVGVDKNYCKAHREAGPGLLLFRGRPLTDEEMRVQSQAVLDKAREIDASRPAKPIPKSPPIDRRWRVAPTDALAAVDGWSPWTTETAAHARRKVSGGIVQTWGEFVIEWRKIHPLKRDRERVKAERTKAPHVEGCAGCPFCSPDT